jgi:lipopolysaccharide/colanic/teichoic acid biosynthesis glycosyltransferase
MKKEPGPPQPEQTSPQSVVWQPDPPLICRASKTVLDYAIALPALLLLSPLLLLLAWLVHRQSPGPVLSKRWVLSRHGREFELYSFRTFTGSINGRQETSTRTGRLLSHYQLHTLPRLFNVLKQDISLVGPYFLTSEDLGRCGQCGNRVLSVRPGLTGLWQINSQTVATFQERIQLDIAYVENQSLWLDIKIMLATIPALLRGPQAAQTADARKGS